MTVNRRLLSWALIISLLLVLSFQTFYLQTHYSLDSFGDIGKKDFVAYWTATNLFLSGGNPYDLTLLHNEQQSLGFNALTPQNVWNPPWIFTILSPLTFFTFSQGALCWFVLNILFLFISSVLAVKTLCDENPRNSASFLVITFFAGLLFIPTISTLLFGQLSLFITCSFIGAFWALRNRHDILAGFFLLVPTIKPHLIYLVIVILFYWIIKTKRFKIILSFLSFFSALLYLTSLQSPHAFQFWFHPTDNPLRFLPTTVVSYLGLLYPEAGSMPPPGVVFAIPVIVSVITLSYYLIPKRTPDWKRDLPPLLCLSLFTAPYGWMFDHAILLIVQVALVQRSFYSKTGATNGIKILVLLFILQDFAALLSFVLPYQHLFAWFPLALLGIWMFSTRSANFGEEKL